MQFRHLLPAELVIFPWEISLKNKKNSNYTPENVQYIRIAERLMK
jgi:hypothetical protein